MKKLVLIMLVMIFAVCQAYAQTSEEAMPQDTSVVQPLPSVANSDGVTKSDLAEISALLNALGQKMLEEDADVPAPPYMMIGKTRVVQAIEISTIAGKDRDQDADGGEDEAAAYNAGKDGSNDAELPDVASSLNLGMNIGYSLIFTPGKVRDNQWTPNTFGFSYSTGFIASFDRQDDYDVTCDFLWKLGVETGTGHVFSIGIDLLLGGGKTAGNVIDLTDESLTPEPYTDWCWKRGFQFWIKPQLLTTNIKGTDLVIFARYVDSKNPYDDAALLQDGLLNLWQEESWQFGCTLKYYF